MDKQKPRLVGSDGELISNDGEFVALFPVEKPKRQPRNRRHLNKWLRRLIYLIILLSGATVMLIKVLTVFPEPPRLMLLPHLYEDKAYNVRIDTYQDPGQQTNLPCISRHIRVTVEGEAPVRISMSAFPGTYRSISAVLTPTVRVITFHIPADEGEILSVGLTMEDNKTVAGRTIKGSKQVAGLASIHIGNEYYPICSLKLIFTPI